MPQARYDGHADWYDTTIATYAPYFSELVAARAGSAQRIVDVGCGTGRNFAALNECGHVVGIDVSVDQLRLARSRNPAVVRGDAAALPFASASTGCVVSSFTHTDVDDFAALVAEVARVLRPGGRFIYVGTHPCFVGGFAWRGHEGERAEVSLHAGYGQGEVVHTGTSGRGLAARVGTRSRTLAEFLGSFRASGLTIENFDELDTQASVEWSG